MSLSQQKPIKFEEVSSFELNLLKTHGRLGGSISLFLFYYLRSSRSPATAPEPKWPATTDAKSKQWNQSSLSTEVDIVQWMAGSWSLRLKRIARRRVEQDTQSNLTEENFYVQSDIMTSIITDYVFCRVHQQRNGTSRWTVDRNDRLDGIFYSFLPRFRIINNSSRNGMDRPI